MPPVPRSPGLRPHESQGLYDGQHEHDACGLAVCVRQRVGRELGIYLPSLSCRTLVYKGMLTPDQLPAFFADLRDERVASAIALVHSRFSTTTFPSWPLAHPYRYIAHSGE